jgi:formate dehydrogenase
MIGKEQIAKMKKGAYLVNNARGPIVDRDAVVEASKSGQLGGYGGDVWYPQPPGKGQTLVLKSVLVCG